MPKSRNERTSKPVAAKASQVLRDPKSSKAMRSIAASALTQTAPRTKRR